MTAFIATAAESLGDRGNDNLTVPVLSGIILYFLLQSPDNGVYQMLMAILLGFLAAFISVKLKYLTQSGGVTAFILASILYGFGGWKWTVPILTFFVLSSILSKLGKHKTENIFEKGSQRDHTQVLANGGIPALFLILQVLHPEPAFYFAHLGALAAATADTWATEIGMRIGQRPRLITTMKKVPAGTSGGITLGGSIGAFLGALILAFSGLPYLFPLLFTHISAVLIVISFSGLTASFVDSLLGATLQVQYRCPVCQKITEKKFHCHQKNSDIYRGTKWMTNDMVNFFNTLAGATLAVVGFLLLSSIS
jgi:uncharacterized protein (TIGR00297 family)